MCRLMVRQTAGWSFLLLFKPRKENLATAASWSGIFSQMLFERSAMIDSSYLYKSLHLSRFGSLHDCEPIVVNTATFDVG